MDNTKIRKTGETLSNPIGLGNIFEVFSKLENISHLLSEFLPQMERLIELMKTKGEIPTSKSTTDESNLQEKLNELLSIAKETHENSGFVKMVFTQEKPKKSKKKVDKSEAVNEYLRKYNRSMKL